MIYIKWFINYKDACYYDSFYSIFMFSIFDILVKNETYEIEIKNNNSNIYYLNFLKIIDFV